jgi:hypothetical protein
VHTRGARRALSAPSETQKGDPSTIRVKLCLAVRSCQERTCCGR